MFSKEGSVLKIARVFPRVTKATPNDPLAFYGLPNGADIDVDEVHVSVTYTYDIPAGEYLAEQWTRAGYKVRLGGPAMNEPGGEFIPGRYIKEGYVITSRGCPNKCWFCQVPIREGGTIRELEVKEGNNILDDNLLACSDDHIRKVFKMLKRQKYGRPFFTGGLEAKRLKPWHVELLAEVKPKEIFFAYDTADDYEPLVQAGRMLDEAGFTLRSRKKFAYVLIGYPWDTFEKAEKRLIDTLKAGFMPFAMQYRNESGFKDPEWGRFQRLWSRPAAIVASNKEFFKVS
jgi:hypothetical protein